MEQNTLDDVLNFIRTYLEENDQLSPSVREIAAGCYISDGTTRRCLDILEAQERIKRHRKKARTIRVAHSS
jgi:DNA-binding transcriptional regulator YhcF (GntR family)